MLIHDFCDLQGNRGALHASGQVAPYSDVVPNFAHLCEMFKSNRPPRLGKLCRLQVCNHYSLSHLHRGGLAPLGPAILVSLWISRLDEDFGAGGVHHDGYHLLASHCGIHHVSDSPRVELDVAVGEVEPCAGHAALDHVADGFHFLTCRANGDHDFRSSSEYVRGRVARLNCAILQEVLELFGQLRDGQLHHRGGRAILHALHDGIVVARQPRSDGLCSR
mmetsp:Transcript_2435/g.7482  ORF Transcript_2435/g.7482 Transcript_2435/m.7482 type:complete len:220 (-) Transcript_2435:154-813(-)